MSAWISAAWSLTWRGHRSLGARRTLASISAVRASASASHRRTDLGATDNVVALPVAPIVPVLAPVLPPVLGGGGGGLLGGLLGRP